MDTSDFFSKSRAYLFTKDFKFMREMVYNGIGQAYFPAMAPGEKINILYWFNKKYAAIFNVSCKQSTNVVINAFFCDIVNTKTSTNPIMEKIAQNDIKLIYIDYGPSILPQWLRNYSKSWELLYQLSFFGSSGIHNELPCTPASIFEQIPS